ncbi:hypothetical protein BY458DRAFT_533609 [Sporodiniella umbellata]|nr:hypothetical protein BY458DRAFT_533609 [Sporodiniella umbellata]
MEEERSLVILYGSETGCAQDVAENLARQSRRRHFKTKVMAMDDYEKTFWKFLLRKNLPSDILSDLDCAVIGLGDSSYRNFNHPSKKLYKRLLQLGANMLTERGDCDDQHYLGVDGAFVPWAKQLWEAVMKKYPSQAAILPDTVLLAPRFGLDAEASERPRTGFDMKVVQNTRITATDHFQDVRHIQLECESEAFTYEPGDIAVIQPQNLKVDVDGFLEQMGWTDSADRWLRFTEEDVVAFSGTLRDLLTYHLDIFGVPRRSFFEMLSYFTKDENMTERLREFTLPEGQDDMWAYCMRPRRTIAEVLYDFRPAEIPFEYLLDLFPPLRPRSFSIASSPQTSRGQMALCVAIVRYKTKLQKIRRGVMTRWLATLHSGDTVPQVRILRGTMQLPPVSDIPLITIGPGTGVAPMRSFLEERVAMGAEENILFFGCRHETKDFHYRDQWETYERQGELKVFAAFSRDQDQKMYVQHQLLARADLVWDWIDQRGAKVLLSGSADKMPNEVAYALKQIFMSQGGLSASESEAYFQQMNKTGQYQEECWS